MKKKILISIIIMIMLPAGIIGSRYITIKSIGINLKPKKVIRTVICEKYNQNDSTWSDINLGNTNFTMGSQGCLVSSIAMALDIFDYNDNPADVNAKLIQADAYNKNGQIIWNKINDAFNEIDYDYKKLFSSRLIDRLLSDGLYPLIKVRYKKMGVFHWVLIVGSDENDYLIMDPLSKGDEPIPLQTHGRVFAVRWFVQNK